MQHFNTDIPYCGPEISVKQGECLTGIAGLTGSTGPVMNLEEYTISFLISGKYKELRFSTSLREGVYPLELQDDGTVVFQIDGDMTRCMIGKYFVECKITKGDKVIVSDKAFAFEIVESRIGIIDNL